MQSVLIPNHSGLPDHHFDQMLREPLEIRIISEHVFMLFSQRFLRIHSGFQVSLFGVIRMHEIIIRHWESGAHYVFDIDLRRVEQLSYVLVSLLLVVLVLVPGLDRFPVPLKHYEICIEQQNDIVLHLLLI